MLLNMPHCTGQVLRQNIILSPNIRRVEAEKPGLSERPRAPCSEGSLCALPPTGLPRGLCPAALKVGASGCPKVGVLSFWDGGVLGGPQKVLVSQKTGEHQRGNQGDEFS